MTVIITMSGLGSRFRKVGYTVPKYMIEAKGKKMFEWSMGSLVDYNSNVKKYVLLDDAAEFIKEPCAPYGISNVDVVEIDYMTMGRQQLVCWQFFTVIRNHQLWFIILILMLSHVK